MVNKHGEFLSDFLITTNMCTINGRLGQSDFTYVSNRGKSVIDYCLVPHEQLCLYKDFSVASVVNVINQNNLHLPCPLSKLPDHALLWCQLDMSYWRTNGIRPTTDSVTTVTKYMINRVPQGFLSDRNRNDIIQTIQKIQTTLDIQHDVNTAYSEILTLVRNEMDDKIPKRTVTLGSYKSGCRRRKCKKYWNGELQQSWANLCQN